MTIAEREYYNNISSIAKSLRGINDKMSKIVDILDKKDEPDEGEKLLVESMNGETELIEADTHKDYLDDEAF